ncbi:MAG: nuclear transport factor 2 family protein [Chitinophagales bacterium]|jgi:ketosteroid isomerase-like protein|nr:nuclear transport factor 2 family protein [Chitinophagales bacterium]
MQKPTMQIWTDAWHNAEPEIFKNVYAQNALIFPPNKPAVIGNENILNFMRGGLGKVDVIFEPEYIKVNDNITFEYGIFKDVSIEDRKVTGEGKYSVTWVLDAVDWKVLCHTWEMPIKY